MAQQTINVGAAPNDGTGTPLRTAFQYTNSNFSELYTATGPSGNNITVPGTATISGDLTVDTNVLKVDTTLNRVGINTASPSVPLHILNNTAATNTAVDVLLISQTSTGTPASGLGGGLLFRSQRPSGGLILNRGAIYGVSGADPDDNGDLAFYTLTNTGPTGFTEKYRLDSNGVATWSNVGGVAGTAMILNANGLGVGTSPTSQLTVGSGGTANPAATVAFHKSTSDEYRLKLTSSTFNAAGKWIGLGLGYSSDYMKMAIIAEAKDSNARGNLYFALNGDATSANASIADAKMTLKSTGQVRFVPLAADPSGAEAGDVYYNSTSNKLKCYNGTTWNDLF